MSAVLGWSQKHVIIIIVIVVIIIVIIIVVVAAAAAADVLPYHAADESAHCKQCVSANYGFWVLGLGSRV